MKLIELTANKKSFKTIRFNEYGVSLIVAIRETQDARKTYNSVGKSLAGYLVHFCLGATPSKDFKEKLADWEFTLKFKINSSLHTSTRKVSNFQKVILDDEEISLNTFKSKLSKEVFEIPEGSKYLTFRSLISRFIRGKRDGYIHYDRFIEGENKNPVSQLINNAFLLGLDIQKVLKKNDLKETYDKTEKLKKNIQKDPIIRSFFGANQSKEDVDLRIHDLKSRIKKIDGSLRNFEVAEDYGTIKKEADELSKRLKSLRNQATKIRNSVANIDRSLVITPDISRSRLIKFYKEAYTELRDSVHKKLKEVELFNKKLIDNRIKRLSGQKGQLLGQLQNLDEEIAEVGQLENQKLQYLDTHGALDEFVALNKQLSEYNNNLEKIQEYQKLISEYENQLRELNKNFIDENIATDKYLKAKPALDRNIGVFKSLTQQFYSDKVAGIVVKNNERKNKIRYDIIAKIQDDAGDAVNEVKIFCFDWTILKNQFNHGVKFIFHDSRIIDGMDTRQIATILKIANKESNEHRFQYILSLNHNIVADLKKELTEEEYEEIINDKIVLRLSDKADSEKLLGVQVDLKY